MANDNGNLTAAGVPGYVPRLKQRYREEAVPKLQREFEIANLMAVPRLEKVILNMGLGEATQNIKILDAAADELGQIAGQKPVITRAKKSIAAFKLREGTPIGCRVTLRGARMWEFLDRMISTALPRVRDFRGVPASSFDGRGNYTLGIKDHLVFPDVDYDKVDRPKGMNVTIVTSAETDEQAFYLLRELGMPFSQPRGDENEAADGGENKAADGGENEAADGGENEAADGGENKAADGGENEAAEEAQS